MPTEPKPVDEAIQTGLADILGQPGPVIVAPSVPPLTLSPLDYARLTGFRDWLTTLIRSSVVPPIGGLDPNQSQGPPAGTEP